MFNNSKNDPLVGAVQQAMLRGQEERQRIAKVNEAFGVQAKRQLPHERHAEYDRAIAEAKAGIAPKALTEEKLEEKRVDSMGSDAMETMSKRDREAANDQAKLKKTLAAKDKAKRVKAILKRRLGKGDGTESVSQSRREDK